MTDLAKKIRADFPFLQQKIKGRPLIYFDNGASTQKPLALINAMADFYKNTYANIHRGVYDLAENASLSYEGARAKVANFINANPKEIVFTKGATEAINLVANSLSASCVFYPRAQKLTLEADDEILISQMEHHANLVPWQEVAKRRGAKLKFIPVTPKGELDLSELDKLINKNTKLVALTHISNTLGTINPIGEIIEKAHNKNALVLIDGAQAVAHTSLDMRKLDADFYVFSGHKVYAPTGIGVLYTKADLLEELPVWQTGGDMVETVDFTKATFAKIPHRFEAGTPPIVEAYGLKVALDYISNLGIEHIEAAEVELLNYANERIKAHLPELKIYGEAEKKAGIISFTLPQTDLHPQDIGILLNEFGICVRTGHHCNMPLLKLLGAGSTARISFGIYNNFAEVDFFITSMRTIIDRFI